MIVQAAHRARGAALTLRGRVLPSADHRALFNSALLVGLLTLGVKVVTLVRDMIVASRYGTSDANDAFLAAWVIPGFLGSILTSGFMAGLIPVQIEARTKHGGARERAVISEVMLLSTVSYLAITLFLVFTNRTIMPLVAQGYSESKFELAAQLSVIMLPAVAIGGIASIWSAILNANGKFGMAAFAPVTIPIVASALLLLWPNAGIEWLAAAFVTGTGLQAAVLYLEMQRRGIQVSLGWHGLLPETRAVLRQFGVICANAVVLGGIGVVDSAMAATLGPGSQSTLTYANKLIVPVLGISSTALGTAVLPFFSRLAAVEDWDGLRHTLHTYVRLILACAIPVTVLIIVFSRPLVRLLFERGEFSPDDTEAVARVLATYSLLVPVETIAVLMSRVLLSLQIGKAMVFASVGIFVSNIVSDYFLKEMMGIEGIALATVANQVISLVFLIFMWRHLQRTRMKRAS